jgi:phage N-6-adenine-methyltransferase
MTPPQKPGRSRQDYGTPPEFLAAVKARLGIREFDCDIAASEENAVAPMFVTKSKDALSLRSWTFGAGWNWLNPEYADITPWVYRSLENWIRFGNRTAVLIPAGVGSNWWAHYVHQRCGVVFLNGRLTFVGCKDPYPKDCALLLYGADPGYDVWTWKPAVARRHPTAGAEIPSSESGTAHASAPRNL